MKEHENIKQLVKCAILTGRIKHEKPLSLLLIAPPEHGKSHILQSFFKDSRIVWANDLSQKPLIKEILPKLQNGCSHIVCPDLLPILSHGHKVANTLITTMNSLMEEGLQESYFFGQRISLKEPLNAGFITSITTDALRRRAMYWREIGFMSRLLPVSFKYKKETIDKIHEMIRNEEDKDPILEKLPKASKEISIDEATIKLIIEQEARKQAKIVHSPTGFRIHNQFQTLAKAIALMNHRDKVEPEDIATLNELTKFVNFEHTEI